MEYVEQVRERVPKRRSFGRITTYLSWSISAMAKRSGSYEYADAVAFLKSHSMDNPWLQAPRSRTLQRKTLVLANAYNFHVYYF